MSNKSPEEEAIRKMAAGFEAAWNRHDAMAMASYWTDDGDLVNPSGRTANGRQEVARLFAEEQKTYMAKTTFAYRPTSVRLVRSDVAIVETEATINGMLDESNVPVPATHFSVFTVMVKGQDGNWRYAAVRPRSQKVDYAEMSPKDAVSDKGSVMPNRSNPPIRYILFHTPGPKWSKAIPFNNQPGVEKHVVYMSQLSREGLLVMGGPFLDNSGGMAILQTATIEEALELGQADPAVQSGLLNAAVRAWMVPMARGGSAPKSPARDGEAP